MNHAIPPPIRHRVAVMDGNKEALAAIPTENLVLALLQELASRVERLENVDKAGTENSASALSKHNSFAQNLPNEELLNTDGTITPPEAYHKCASEDISIPAADRCCISHYGFFLDGDNVGMTLKR